MKWVWIFAAAIGFACVAFTGVALSTPQLIAAAQAEGGRNFNFNSQADIELRARLTAEADEAARAAAIDNKEHPKTR